MTNTQLYLAIGVPLLGGMLFNGILIGLMWSAMNSRFEAMQRNIDIQFQAVNQRINDLRDTMQAKLERVEGVLDARLKHLEG